MHIERRTGRAADFITAALPEPLTELTVQVFDLAAPALVLGSAQVEQTADLGLCASRGIDVVRRRSGGGAVFLAPHRCIWIDVILPRTDPRWVEDVGTAGDWLGELWATALADLGVETQIHRDPLQKTQWGRLVCFGSLGPGEVTIAGRKLVGVAQRRTRVGARFQCLVLDEWRPAEVVDLLVLDPDDAARARVDLAPAAIGSPTALKALEEKFLERLQEPV